MKVDELVNKYVELQNEPEKIRKLKEIRNKGNKRREKEEKKEVTGERMKQKE